jgi:uncharacterized repeat protein (TIGR02543 family)
MKKRVLAVLMALCISSLNTMGAFAAAVENGTNSMVETEENVICEENGTDYEEDSESDTTAESDPEDAGKSEENKENIPDQNDGSAGNDSQRNILLNENPENEETWSEDNQNENSSEEIIQSEGDAYTDIADDGSGLPENDGPVIDDFQSENGESAVETITLNKTEIKLTIGEQYQLEASFGSEEATVLDMMWTSSDDEVAMVDDTGLVTANGFGTAIVTVNTANGKFAECKVEVESPYYNISYVLNGGTNAKENPATYNRNEEVRLLNPVRKGYVFTGWFEDEELTKKVTGIPAGQTGDKVFYAKWVGKTYIIVFDGNSADSGEMSRVTYKVGENEALPENMFIKQDNVFVEWNTETDGTGSSVKDIESLNELDAENGSTITLYAQWKIKSFKINYMLNGGTNNKANPTEYNVKEEISSLEKPVRKGYTFQGWFTDAKFTKEFNGIKIGSAGDKTVYAKWKIVKYTVNYVLNNGKAPSGNPTSYFVTTATIRLKNPTRKNYTFLGWFKDAEFTNKISAIPTGSTGNLKLYAKWTPTKYTITYKLNGGTNNKKNPATFTFTSAKITFAKPTRKGYTFQGWYSDSKFKKKITLIKKGSTGNRTVYAKWKINKYTIKYVLNNGIAPTGNPSSYTVNSAVTLKNPKRTGYLFKGWYTDKTFKTNLSAIVKGTVGNKTLYAKWAPIQYTIRFNAGKYADYCVGSMEDIQCKYGQTYKLPKIGFKSDLGDTRILEWNTRADGKGKTIKNLASVKNLTSTNGAVITLYGIWYAVASEVLITYKDSYYSSINVAKGFTRKIGIELYPGYSNEKVTFSSSNTKVATVSSSGVIKGVSKGKAKITATTISGKKDSIIVNVVDNQRTWNISYNLRYYDYGEPTVAAYKMYYSGNNLVLEALVANNRAFTADYFDYITITLYDSNGKQIAKKKFTNYSLNMGSYSTKKVKFVLGNAKKADIIDGDYDYDYWYTYTY